MRSLSPANRSRSAFDYDSLNESSDFEATDPRSFRGKRVGVQLLDPAVVVGKRNDERVEARWQTFNTSGYRGLLEGPLRPGVRAKKCEGFLKAERGGGRKESESAARLEALAEPKERLSRAPVTRSLGADIIPNGRPSGSGAGDSTLMSGKQAILPHSGGASGVGYKEIYNRQRAANAANQTQSGMQWQETAIELIRSLMDNMVTTRSIEVKRRCMQSIENEVSKLAYDSAILHRERIRYTFASKL